MTDAKIFADLKADHDRHRKLLKQLARTSDDSEDRSELFEELRQELQAHAAAEEESLYATMLGKPDLREDARHSVSEHKEIDDLLGELVELDADDEDWLDQFEELKERYIHHIDEEEEEMFPTAAAALTAEEEADLAAIFEKRKPKELARAASEMPGDARE
jgi:hemerythrin-like domain-containing protein